MASTEFGNFGGNVAASFPATDHEPMRLNPSDHPGMILVSAVLTGSNYLAWSKAIQRALAAKMKLDFIDGTTIRPNENTEEYKRWNRIDSMVTTWILNTISKELVEAFMYVSSARELWLELKASLFNAHLYGETTASECQQHGIAEWSSISDSDARKKSMGRGRPFAAVTTAVNEKTSLQIDGANIADIIRTEVRRAMNDEMPMDPLKVNFVHLEEYAGSVKLSQDITLSQVLHIPKFSVNLISVKQLCSDSFFQFRFLNSECILQDPKSEKTLLGDAILVATYLINRFPTVTLNWKTLFEVLYNKQPSYSYLRVFGCLCYAVNPDPQKTKFDKRGSKCIFLGYPPGQKAYKEPRCYKQASTNPQWVDAMKHEIQALERNGTWEVVPLPDGKQTVGCKWVFKVKLKDDGSLDRYKARLVAKGYTQVEGVDYTERFSPVAKAVTVRLFLAIGTAKQWPIHQIDINNTFLHGHLDEEIFMTAREGYDVPLVYVDDVLIMAPSEDFIAEIKTYLDGLFTIKDLGMARYFLGLQIARSALGTSVTQSKYISDIITDCGLTNSKSVVTPLPQGVKLHSASDAFLSHPEPYRRLVGRLLYLGFTRSDIPHEVQQLSQFLQKSCQAHWHAALHMVRYLNGSSTQGLFFPSSNSLRLRAYCDADWGSCLDSRRSLTGFCVFLGDALVSWKTKKQCTVSRSSAEAEYRSMAATVCELKWISYLLHDFDVLASTPIPLHCDNQAALHIMANLVFHERTKHLDIDCHIVRDCYKSGFVSPSFIRSKEQLADVFTKTLPGAVFHTLVCKLGLFAGTPRPTCGGGVGNMSNLPLEQLGVAEQ
ncbi:UNVERIFIED_CONTAM: Retrovirus-related Pol polyprotein from transposon RE2 [Sesamum radiatum]|uniref:Retrovirus-related Pol polyprotein from transposon RE2 n=1 Tax=Sesamum radiatum TaxID=300843 RepID=A0AAW2T6M7_SESRA